MLINTATEVYNSAKYYNMWPYIHIHKIYMET